jgi:hypothetical protein
MRRLWIIAAALLAILLLQACGSKETSKPVSEGHHAAEDNANHESGHGTDSGTSMDQLRISYSFAGGSAESEASTAISIQIDHSDGTPVEAFEMNHEKLLHLVIVNHDLSYFSHIHPDYKGNGVFTAETTFPYGGRYAIYADFVPKGGSNTTLHEWVEVEGESGPHAPIEADNQLSRTVDGKDIELALSTRESGEEAVLAYSFRDARTDDPIRNLEPYLGAVGHVVILSDDAEQYLHVHPIDESGSGPEARFATSFPKQGLYRIWGQFQHEGEVFTVPFTVKIN